MTHSNVANECYQEKIKELIDLCSNEYYMSALPLATTKERASRGKNPYYKPLKNSKPFGIKRNALLVSMKLKGRLPLKKTGYRKLN